MINVSREQCVGCEACSMVCPKSAITMNLEEGFRYALVDSEKCVECHLCEKVCPAMTDTENLNSNDSKVYAVWSKDPQVRVSCTSGGVCYELSKYIINSGGYVAGVVWTEDYQDAKYIITNNIEDLEKLKQTKYFQPQMNDIFKKVKIVLEKGFRVLYVGSSCTNDALKRFLGKKYDNLICVDYICRGYTSQVFHQKRIKAMEDAHKSAIKFVQYKNKRMGWNRFGTLFSFLNGEEEYINRADDSYELMFQIEDNNTRPSCFECKYRTLPRHTDITVGDFWGIKGLDDKELFDGVSAVILSSEKGKRMFSLIADEIFFEERSISEVASGNGALLKQLTKPNDNEFFQELERLPFKEVEKKFGSKVILRRRKILSIIKLLCRCNIFQFVYYNFLCRKIIRRHHKFIFPFYGSRIQLAKTAKIIVNDNLYLNNPKHRLSNEQCYLKIMNGGVLEVNGVCKFAANNTVEINCDAILKLGKLDANYNTTIICGNRIEIGNDVGFGRNVMIYDNNFHATGMNRKIKLKPLIIEDHVWLCTGVTIVKGLKIEVGAVCSINSTITRNVKSKNLVAGNPAKVVMTNVVW